MDKIPLQINQSVIAVGVTATPLSSNPALTSTYIDSFVLCVYKTAAQSAFFGDANVLTTNGLEIPPGISITLSINNDAVYYNNGINYPFTYFDLSQLYLIAAAPMNVVIIPFKRSFV